LDISLSSLTDYTTVTGYSTQDSQLEDSLKNTDYSTATEEELMDACKEFEAYFVEQVFKEVEKTIPKNEEDEDSYASQITDYFKDELIQEYSEQVSDSGSLGLAEQLYEQMKRNYGL
jgi:flagellar protein FlgJ